MCLKIAPGSEESLFSRSSRKFHLSPSLYNMAAMKAMKAKKAMKAAMKKAMKKKAKAE